MTPTPPYKVAVELHRAVVNLPNKIPKHPQGGEWPIAFQNGYDLGHYDARHAAAELVVSALSASPALAPTDEAWRPIESAPKDGTEFIGRRGDELRLCSWAPLNNPVAEHWGCAGTWHRRSPRSGKDLLGGVFQPAEWIPMPAPPKVDTSTPSGDQNSVKG